MKKIVVLVIIVLLAVVALYYHNSMSQLINGKWDDKNSSQDVKINQPLQTSWSTDSTDPVNPWTTTQDIPKQ